MAREHYSINNEAAKIALQALKDANSTGNIESMKAYAAIADAAARLVDATKG